MVIIRFATGCLIAAGGALTACGRSSSSDRVATTAAQRPCRDAGLTLPHGFCATVFADSVGHVRHMTVSPNGTLYINTWSGRYYGNDQPHAGWLSRGAADTTGRGRADVIVRFGDSVQSGGARRHRYREYTRTPCTPRSNDKIVRYALPAGSLGPTGAADVIVDGLPLTGDHPMHPIRHRFQRIALYRCRVGDQRLPGQEPHRAIAGPSTLHGARDPRGYLAVRRRRAQASISRRTSVLPQVSAMPTASRSIDGAHAVRRAAGAATSCMKNWPKLYTDLPESRISV